MPEMNIIKVLLIGCLLLVGAALWRMLSMNKDVRQKELAGLLGGAGSGIDAADIGNFIKLMGWDKVEAMSRLAHAISMVKVMVGPEQHEASLAVYRQVLDQIGGTERIEPQFACTDDKPPTTDHEPSDAMIHVHGSDWKVVNGTLRRTFDYHGLIDHHSVHRLQIDIDRSDSVFEGFSHYHFHMFLAPHPWPDEGEGFLIAHLGPEHDLINHPAVKVRCERCDDGSLLIGTVDCDGTNAVLNAISRCTPMRLLLTGPKGTLLELPIPNDDSFSRAGASFFH